MNILISTLLAFTMFLNCKHSHNNQNQIHLIQDKYIGRILIVYNEKDGLEVIRKDSIQTLEIPICGIVKYNNTYLPTMDFSIFYKTKNGLESIQIVDNYEKIDSSKLNTVCAFGFISGGFSQNGIRHDYAFCYYIDTLKNLNSYRDFSINKLEYRECQ